MAEKREVAARLDQYLDGRLNALLQFAAGAEREILIEVVRSLDLHSYFLHFYSYSEQEVAFAARCHAILQGSGPILRALLPRLDQYGDGIPLVPSNRKTADWVDAVLAEAGRLSMLRRLAHCERYGLTRTEVRSDNHLSIHVEASDIEAIDRADQAWLIASRLRERDELQDQLDSQLKGWALDRIDKYVRVWRKHFIRYESDWELLGLYREQARSAIMRSPEADTFPDDVMIGPRTFGDWKSVVITAVARSLLHISFATRLYSKHKGRLDLRNLLTVHARQEDLRAVWSQQTGVTEKEELDDISDIFMLTSTHADEYYRNFDYPLPYNIRFGRYFALLPQFGSLGNACTFLVTELRRKYRKDWDKAVNLREAKFQLDLYKLLPEPRYIRGRENVVLRYSANLTATDIDAVLFDRISSCIYLFQLKWFDVFGTRLNERQSKLANLLDTGKKWIEKVDQWLSETPKRDVISALGLGQYQNASDATVRLMILTRNVVRFSGPHNYDKRAGWISWPALCRAASENPDDRSVLESAWTAAMLDSTANQNRDSTPIEYSFPNLKIDLWTREQVVC